MKYTELVEGISEVSGYSPKAVEAIIKAIPPVLMDLKEDEKVSTPLGIFYSFVSIPRELVLPDQVTKAFYDTTFSVKLKPGKNLKRKL